MATGELFSGNVPRDGFDSVELRAYNRELEEDETLFHTVRIRGWQKIALNTIKNKSGTNISESAGASYMEGLQTIRSTLVDKDIDELVLFMEKASEAIMSDDHDEGSLNESLSYVLIDDIEDPFREHGRTEETVNVKLKDSAYSEVCDTFDQDLNTGGWIHRAMVSIGIQQSSSCHKRLKDKASEVEEGTAEVIAQSRREIESGFQDYVMANMSFWRENGIYKSKAEALLEAAESMNTHMGASVASAIKELQEQGKVVEGE